MLCLSPVDTWYDSIRIICRRESQCTLGKVQVEAEGFDHSDTLPSFFHSFYFFFLLWILHCLNVLFSCCSFSFRFNQWMLMKRLISIKLATCFNWERNAVLIRKRRCGFSSKINYLFCCKWNYFNPSCSRYLCCCYFVIYYYLYFI